MRCPTCGSENVRPGKGQNQYICERCRSVFFSYQQEKVNESLMNQDISNKKEFNRFDFEELSKSMVLLKTENTEGVGFIISKEGHVLTNAHVLDGNSFCYGQLVGKTKIMEFNVVADGEPFSMDICLLEPSEPQEFIPMDFSKDDVSIGQTVYTIGNPKGLGLSLSKGFISQIKDMQIQLDMTVNPGNSGGPVLNENGKVIGMISYLLKDVQGLGFAVNLKAINKFLEASK